MSSKTTIPTPDTTWSATELRKLPVEERDRILAAQAELAEEEYRTNPKLTDFESFDEGDGNGQSATPGAG